MRGPRHERGVMLIEALIAILIFSIGILAVVGMQSVAIKNVTDAKVRSDAAFLVNEMLSQIWSDAGNINSYQYAGTGSNPRLTAWLAKVNARLPDSTNVPPTITVTGGTPLGGQVQITVFWRLPQEATQGVPAHQHSVIANVAYNPP